VRRLANGGASDAIALDMSHIVGHSPTTSSSILEAAMRRCATTIAAFFLTVLPACVGPAPETPTVQDDFVTAAQEVHGELRPDCLAHHLEEAIAQNRTRRPLYAAATAGASERISGLLIALEEASLTVAPRADEPSAAYHAAGIPIVCDGVVPMAWAPSFEPLKLGAIAEPFSPLNGEAIAVELRDALTAGGPEQVAAIAHQWMDRIESTPHRHCMVRHVLESVARIALLAEDHARLARKRRLASPAGIDEDLIRAHVAGLGISAQLDTMAAPLQARGVPILCNDLPTIPMPGDRPIKAPTAGSPAGR
jgi:hypothetical protein